MNKTYLHEKKRRAGLSRRKTRQRTQACMSTLLLAPRRHGSSASFVQFWIFYQGGHFPREMVERFFTTPSNGKCSRTRCEVNGDNNNYTPFETLYWMLQTPCIEYRICRPSLDVKFEEVVKFNDLTGLALTISSLRSLKVVQFGISPLERLRPWVRLTLGPQVQNPTETSYGRCEIIHMYTRCTNRHPYPIWKHFAHSCA